jgi:two-component system sensor histidine kinase/response regulator
MAIQTQVEALASRLSVPPDLERCTLYDLFNGPPDTEALQQHVAELRERVGALETFAHTVAHSLKGSLGGLIGFAMTLKEDEARLTAEQRQDCLEYLIRSGYKLNSIVDELLLLAEMRQQEVTLESIAMAPIVAEAQVRLLPLIEAYQAEILLPATWPLVMGHDRWVEEVWVNYLSNAIKYGGQPPRLQLGSELQPDGLVRFWVRDNGRGLTAEEQTRLFSLFTRLEPRRIDGHGLGLTIVQRIVEKLGGSVGVDSVPGQGSMFSFTLPGC